MSYLIAFDMRTVHLAVWLRKTLIVIEIIASVMISEKLGVFEELYQNMIVFFLY
jgi:hypothetical protein